ncbi:MAG: glycosyltransferase family 2 protein [Bacteroidales bacterium]|jgi:glycosyltransferase involved in cell wall biosynthesis|nr:glycosyltransferase family 2 protein [Bacteroidales bacterium]
MDISIVVPLYNEEESLPELMEWINKVMIENSFSYEVVMVDDGSRDKSWQVVTELKKKYPTLKGVKFQRNYGKSAALHTGFQEVEGDVVITMDADLQDSPEEATELHRMIMKDGYDLVSGWKKKRHDPFSKRFPSKIYNRLVRMVTGIKLHDFNCGLKAYRYDLVKSIEVYGDMHRYMPVLAKAAGFKAIGEKVVQHQARKFGISKFGFGRARGMFDLLTISFISRFGKKPMQFFGTLGTLMFIAGFIAAGWLGAEKLYSIWHGIKAPLVTSSPYFYISLTTMIIGTQLFLVGFLGELVSRSSSDRNNYKIDEKI